MTVGALFDTGAQDYDRSRRQIVPGLDRAYGAVLKSIPHKRGEAIRVLDLGAGTGLLSAGVAGKFPRSRVTLVDISVGMLRVARRRLGEEFPGEVGRFEFRTMDFARKALPGEFDLVVSALSIHHLTDRDKRELFKRVYAALSDGGHFVNLDQVSGATPEEEVRLQKWWLRRVRGAGVSERDLSSARTRMRADKNATLEAQLGWLEGAGFGAVNCVHRHHRFAVYGGVKRRASSDNRKDGDE